MTTTILLLCTLAAAQSAPPPPRGPERSERLEYDPQTGQWVRVAAPIAGTEAGDLERARSLLARGEFSKARKAMRAWRKQYADSPLRPAGLFYSADVETSMVEAGRDGDLMRAYKWHEEILDQHAGTEWADRSLRRELIIAEMFLFKHKKQWVWGGVLRLSATEEALEILDRLIDQRVPGSRLAEQALKLKADYLFGAGEFDEAERTYARLAQDFSRGPYARSSLLRSADAAFASFPGVLFDATSLLDADERYRRFARLYPEAAAAAGVAQLLNNIRDKRAEKEFLVGDFYQRTGARSAAIFYYRFVAKTWPDTVAAGRAAARLARMGIETEMPAPATEPTSISEPRP